MEIMSSTSFMYVLNPITYIAHGGPPNYTNN